VLAAVVVIISQCNSSMLAYAHTPAVLQHYT
jgi:hypothetical protein